MAAAPDLGFALDLPPAEAIRYFEGLGYEVSRNAIQAYAAARARAFTVTGVARLDLLQDIKSGLDAALRNGTTLGTFENDLQDLMRRRGWRRLADGAHADPRTGEIVARLPPHRLQTIFRTNVQGALMAGRYQQLMDDVEIAPWWQYVAVMDSKTRPSHAAMHGRIFRYDDPIWSSHFPPCDFNCRCGVRALRQRDLDRRGLVPETSEGKLQTTWIRVGDHEVPATAFVDRTTRVRFVPGPGFGRRPALLSRQPAVVAQGGLGHVVGEKIRAADPGISAAIVATQPGMVQALAADYTPWARAAVAGRSAPDGYRVVGAMSPRVVAALQQLQRPASAALVLHADALQDLVRDPARTLTAAQVMDVPGLMAAARAVLWDHDAKVLVYVVGIRSSGAVTVVQVGPDGRLGAASAARLVDLQGARYELLEGSLAE